MDGERPASSPPKLPRRGGGRSPQRSATFLALAGLLIAGLFFGVLITAVMTGFAPAAMAVVLLAMAAVAFLFGGHYLIWGIWLDRNLASRGQSGPVEFWKKAPLPPIPADPTEDVSEG